MKNISESLKKHPLMKGTMLLTFSSFICRALGFLYRLIASKQAGNLEIGLLELGINLITIPLCLCVHGSKVALTGRATKNNLKNVFFTSLIYAFTKALFLSILIYAFAPFISTYIFHRKSLYFLIRILALSLPFTTFSIMSQGYFIVKGQHKSICSMQILEEIIKILTFSIMAATGKVLALHLALALLIGEIAEFLYTLIKLYPIPVAFSKEELKYIVKISLPITFTRILVCVFNSAKNIILPSLFIAYGLSEELSISLLGQIRGIALPIVLFPVSVFVAYSTLLLPKIAAKKENIRDLSDILTKSLYLCLIIGFASTLAFIFGLSGFFGIIFNPELKAYLNTLAFLCPLLNISLTASSILNGLGQSKIYMRNNISAMIIEITLMFILVPKYCVWGYLICMLVSELTLACINLLSIIRYITTRKEYSDTRNN